MENIQNRVQDAITNMIHTLDKEHLRKMQADMYRCSATCCETPQFNMDEAQHCVERCSKPLNEAQNTISQELQSLQDRLQRCAMDCQDKVRDKVGPKTTEVEVSKYRTEMESCVVKCGDTHIALVPAMMKRIKEVLSSHK